LDATIALVISAYFYDSADLSLPYDLPRPYAHFHGYLSLSLYCDFIDALRRIQDPARFEYRIFGDRERLFSEGDETNSYLTGDERKRWDGFVKDYLEVSSQDEKKEIREGKSWRIYAKGTRENPIWVEDDPLVVTSVVAGERRVPRELRSKLTSRSILLQPAARALAIDPLPIAEAPARSLNSAPAASTSTRSPVRNCLTCSSDLEHEIFSQTNSSSSQHSDDTSDSANNTDDFITIDQDVQEEEVQLVGRKGKDRMEGY
jgi:hypothetical protein